MRVSDAQFERIAVCGLGLIGGSVVRTLRAVTGATHITGLDTDRALLARLQVEGWIDEAAQDAQALFANHDLVVLCQPVGALLAFVREQAAAIGAGRAVVVDVASVKAPITAAMEPAAAVRFVPSHPIAGKAVAGWQASEAGLFQGRRCILTPTLATGEAELARAQTFWALMGAHTSTMPAAEHDAIYAAMSHLPQVITYAYLHSLAAREAAAGWLDYQGSGFRSFARLGSSDAALWSDIALHNRAPLLAEIDLLCDAMALMRGQLAQNDAVSLTRFFERARAFHAQDPSAVQPT